MKAISLFLSVLRIQIILMRIRILDPHWKKVDPDLPHFKAALNRAYNSISHLDVWRGVNFFTFCTKNFRKRIYTNCQCKTAITISSHMYNLFQIDIDNQVLHRSKIMLIV